MKSKDKIQLCVIAVLVIVLLFAVISGTRRVRKVRRLLVRPAAAEIKKSPSVDITLTKKIAEEKSIKQDKGLFRKLETEAKKIDLKRDPFSRTMIEPIETFYSPINLSGILWDEKNPSAIINGKIVGVGDKVDGNTVVSIEQDLVILNDGISDFIIKLEQ